MRWSGRSRDLADAYWVLILGIAVGLVVGILILYL
jgi:hypothetical protein